MLAPINMLAVMATTETEASKVPGRCDFTTWIFTIFSAAAPHIFEILMWERSGAVVWKDCN
jgi:hypothetical protein